jgi:hypothetical protein
MEGKAIERPSSVAALDGARLVSTTNHWGPRFYGVRWQVKRDTALASGSRGEGAKAPSSLRSAGALHRVVLARCAALDETFKKAPESRKKLGHQKEFGL